MVARVKARRRHRDRQDQHARVGRGREHPQRRLWRDRQPVRSRRSRRPARRAARPSRSPPAWRRSAPAPTPAAACAIPAAFCGVVGFRPTPGLVPSEKRALGWNPLLGAGADGRTVADASLLLSAMVSDDAPRPAGDHHPRPHRPPRRASSRRRRRSTSPPARRHHARLRLRAHRAAHRRDAGREDAASSATCSPAPTIRRPTAPTPTRPSRCCARWAT